MPETRYQLVLELRLKETFPCAFSYGDINHLRIMVIDNAFSFINTTNCPGYAPTSGRAPKPNPSSLNFFPNRILKGRI